MIGTANSTSNCVLMLCCRCCCADFQHEFSTLNEGNLEIVNEMGIIADEETTVEVTAGSHVVGDIMIKADELNSGLITVVQLDDGLAQVHCVFCLQLCVNLLRGGAGVSASDLRSRD